jgi:Tfp pilus assembly protein PilN
VAALSLVFMVMSGRSLSTDIASLDSQIARTNQQSQQRLAQQRQLTTRTTELESDLKSVSTLGTSLAAAVNLLDSQAREAGNALGLAMNGTPQNLTLTALRQVGDVVTLTGRAQAEKQVLSYIEGLDDTGQFGSIVFTDMTRGDDGISFTIVGVLEMKGIGASSIEVALGSLPSGVLLTSMTSSDASLNIDGTAPTADRVFAYLRALEASGTFRAITLVRIARTSDESTTFSLVLNTGG